MMLVGLGLSAISMVTEQVHTDGRLAISIPSSEGCEDVFGDYNRNSSTFLGVITLKNASGYALEKDSGARTFAFLSFHLNS